MERISGLSSRKARRAKRKAPVLERLSPQEAQVVLGRLLEAHPDLYSKAESIACSRLGEVNFETIAGDVEEAVRALDLDVLHGRAGRHAWGYVEPTDAAWEILEEAVKPFVANMKRRAEMGLDAEALEICNGVVLGLYRVKEGDGGELLGYAPDFPEEAAGDTLAIWRTRGRGKKKTAGAPPRRSPSRVPPGVRRPLRPGLAGHDRTGVVSEEMNAWDDNQVFRVAARWRTIQFKRYRRRIGDDGGRRLAGAFRLTFREPVRGPIALGWSSHFGMGLFAPDSGSSTKVG